MTTKETIADWFKQGMEQKATHMIVVCDTWDWEDFPVYVKVGQDVHEIYKEHIEAKYEKVMEVYNLSMDMEKQLNEFRAKNF